MKKRTSILLIALVTVMLAGCGTIGMIDSSNGRDGSSFEKAVIAGSVRAEYLYVDRTFPGSNLMSQLVKEHNGKIYDIITITTKEGEEKEVCFDISKFYRKKSYADDLE